MLEGEGVEGGADFGVVVEVDVDVAGGAGEMGGADAAGGACDVGDVAQGPGEDAVGPEIQGVGLVAAGVELLGAVEAEVDEVGGDVEEEGPVYGVGDDEADVVKAQEGDEVWVDEGLVADFDAMAEGQAGGAADGREGGAAIEARAMLTGESGGLGVGAGELAKEVGEAGGVKAHLRGKLPEDGAEFGAELENAGGEEVGQRLMDVAELQHVGDEARTFDAEDEAGRGGG